MRGLEGTFLQVKERLVYEETSEHKVILLSTVLLFNLSFRLVGINQILSTFMLHTSPEANQLIL